MFEAPSSTSGWDRVCIQWVFCRKFNFGQLLFEAFFNIIGTFGRNQVKCSLNFENSYFLPRIRIFVKICAQIRTHLKIRTSGNTGVHAPVFVKVWVRKWIWIKVSVCMSNNLSKSTVISVDKSLFVSLSENLILNIRVRLYSPSETQIEKRLGYSVAYCWAA